MVSTERKNRVKGLFDCELQTLAGLAHRYGDRVVAERYFDAIFGLGGFVHHEAGMPRGLAVAAASSGEAIQRRYLRVSDAVRN